MTETIDQFKALLAAFKELPRTPQRDPTILEILGYPYSKWENAYSNTLAFFLDPGREHGFGPLFLKSLLFLAKGRVEKQDTQEVEVSREVRTATDKRIDLVIETKTLIVGIENKIRNGIHNDLEDYGRYLEESANGRDVCKILLGLNLPDDAELSGFKLIKYQEYFDEVLRRIGPAIIGSTDRYMRFALEVIETVKHLTEDSAMDSQMLDFFTNNREEVESLVQEVEKLSSEMRCRIHAIREGLNISDLKGRRIEDDYYRRDGGLCLWDCLRHDIAIEDNFVLCIETTIYPSGWEIEAWEETGQNSQRVDSWFEAQNGPRTFPYDADPSEVAAQLRHLLESAMTDPFPKSQ